MRGDAPPPQYQEGLSDIGMCSLWRWGSARNLCRPCKFQVVESGHPIPPISEGVRLPAILEKSGNIRTAAWGWWKRKRWVRRGMERRWSFELDLGSDRIFRGQGTSRGEPNS